MEPTEQPEPEWREFQVDVTITFVNNSCMDVPFVAYGYDEDDVRRQITVDYVMRSVSDDWGMPIRNVTVLSVQAVGRAHS